MTYGCRYKPNLDGSKISHIPIDRVYLTYVHYGKSKGKPTYPDAINSCSQSLHTCPIFYLGVIPHSCRGLLDFKRCEWKKKRENMKSEGTTLEGK